MPNARPLGSGDSDDDMRAPAEPDHQGQQGGAAPAGTEQRVQPPPPTMATPAEAGAAASERQTRSPSRTSDAGAAARGPNAAGAQGLTNSGSGPTAVLIVWQSSAGKTAAEILRDAVLQTSEMPSEFAVGACAASLGQSMGVTPGPAGKTEKGFFASLKDALAGIGASSPGVLLAPIADAAPTRSETPGHVVVKELPLTPEAMRSVLPRADALVICRHGSADFDTERQTALLETLKHVQASCVFLVSCTGASARYGDFMAFSHRPKGDFGNQAPFFVGYERIISIGELRNSVIGRSLGLYACWKRAARVPQYLCPRKALKIAISVAVVHLGAEGNPQQKFGRDFFVHLSERVVGAAARPRQEAVARWHSSGSSRTQEELNAEFTLWFEAYKKKLGWPSQASVATFVLCTRRPHATAPLEELCPAFVGERDGADSSTLTPLLEKLRGEGYSTDDAHIMKGAMVDHMFFVPPSRTDHARVLSSTLAAVEGAASAVERAVRAAAAASPGSPVNTDGAEGYFNSIRKKLTSVLTPLQSALASAAAEPTAAPRSWRPPTTGGPDGRRWAFVEAPCHHTELVGKFGDFLKHTKGWAGYLCDHRALLERGNWGAFANGDLVLFTRCVAMGVRPKLGYARTVRHVLIPLLVAAWKRELERLKSIGSVAAGGAVAASDGPTEWEFVLAGVGLAFDCIYYNTRDGGGLDDGVKGACFYGDPFMSLMAGTRPRARCRDIVSAINAEWVLLGKFFSWSQTPLCLPDESLGDSRINIEHLRDRIRDENVFDVTGRKEDSREGDVVLSEGDSIRSSDGRPLGSAEIRVTRADFFDVVERMALYHHRSVVRFDFKGASLDKWKARVGKRLVADANLAPIVDPSGSAHAPKTVYDVFNVTRFEEHKSADGRIRVFGLGESGAVATESRVLALPATLRSRLVLIETTRDKSVAALRSFQLFYTDCHYGQDALCCIERLKFELSDVAGSRVRDNRKAIEAYFQNNLRIHPFVHCNDVHLFHRKKGMSGRREAFIRIDKPGSTIVHSADDDVALFSWRSDDSDSDTRSSSASDDIRHRNQEDSLSGSDDDVESVDLDLS